MSGPNGHFDLDAKRKARLAAQQESDAEPFRFSFGGHEFSLAPATEWPANMKRMLNDGDIDRVINTVISDPELFWDQHPTVADLTDLMDAYGQWSGVGDLGESAGPPPPALTPM